MKKQLKFLVLAMGVLAMTACSKDLYDEAKAQEFKNAEYADAFKSEFGEIDPDQDWGFGTSGETRTASANNNEWKNDWIVPGNISSTVRDRVVTAFENPDPALFATVEWTNFFVQQVHTGHANMDKLSVNGKTDHVNNFNNNESNAIMLMVNTLSTDFYYENSFTDDNDNRWYGDYVILCIDDEYYVGFDYSCNGIAADKKIAADGKYTDWIVKITEATPAATLKKGCRIIAEDLGTTDDFDFNDVVFDVQCGDATYWETIVTVQAAGGTLPLYITIGNKTEEVHALFGVDTDVMVNTTGGVRKAAVTTKFPRCENLNDIKIEVKNKNAIYALEAPQGGAPQKIVVHTRYEWTAEREAINKKYPDFNKYVKIPTFIWY